MEGIHPSSLRDKAHTPVLPKVPNFRHRGGLSIVEAFHVAWQGLISNPLRSILTMLGVIIGVAAVIVMVALGEGAAAATAEAIQKMGTNVLTVRPEAQRSAGVKGEAGTRQSMEIEHADQLLKMCPDVVRISPEYRGNGTVKFGNNNTRTTIYGAYPNYFEIRNLPLADGRYFTMKEVESRAKVAVIGHQIREELFGERQPVGKSIKINGQNFLVVGVAQERGGMAFRNPDDQVTIPTTTAMRRIFGERYLNAMSVQAVSAERMIAAEEQVMAAYYRIHKLGAYDDPPIRVHNQKDLMESANEQSGFLTMLLSGVAMVSLIVGGIGIMNIMLVSVTERTREIGIRKAIGAKRRDILYQFLIESITLSVFGGLLGIGIAIGVALWMGSPASEGGLGFPMQLSAAPIIISFTFSVLVGVFFGLYPAVKASALDPIQALRHE
ncbi:MAG: ABC transporter permease [Armatimonadota bacterium]